VAGTDHVLSKGYLCTGAAAYILGQCVVPVTGSTLDPNQMVIATTGAGAAAAISPIGLVQENVDLVKVQTAKAYATVAIAGIAFGIADGAIAIGAYVKPSGTTAGRLITQAVGAYGQFPIVGWAASPAVNAGDIFTVMLTPGVRI
jgi:hypothetical protein